MSRIAGTDLDVEVARIVMGWTDIWIADGGTGGSRAFVARRSDGSFDQIPRFSTSIAAAWMVIATMADKDAKTFRRWANHPLLYENGVNPGICLLIEYRAEEASVAICVAAIEACLGGREGGR